MKRLIEERLVLKSLPYQPIQDITVKAPETMIPVNFDPLPLHHDLSIYNDCCQQASL